MRDKEGKKGLVGTNKGKLSTERKGQCQKKGGRGGKGLQWEKGMELRTKGSSKEHDGRARLVLTKARKPHYR